MNLPTIPHDKAQHAVYGLAIYAFAALAAELFGASGFASSAFGLVSAAGVAVGRELWQRKHGGEPSVADAAWTIGAALAAAAPALL